jgi:L-threonylcarbamoyladenylate synthase
MTKKLTGKDIEEAVNFLKNGELVAFPTETVYGLGADAENDEAVKKVFTAKGRPMDNPLIVHVSDFEMMEGYVEDLPQSARILAEKFWPGPLTMVLKVKPERLPKSVTAGLPTAAFRMPNTELSLELIQKFGHGVVAPSANTSGFPSPTKSEHVLHDLNGVIAAVLDGGESEIGIESTVVDLTVHGVATILRPGAITSDMLKGLVGHVGVDAHLTDEKETPKAPGMKYTHYSPNARVIIVQPSIDAFRQAVVSEKGNRIGLLADADILDALKGEVEASYCLSEFHNVKYASKRFYDGLRNLDEAKVEVIFVEEYQEIGLGVGLMNRMKKSSGNHFFKA